MDLPNCKVWPDPQVQGVWAIDNYKTGVRVIVYLAGYKTPGGNIRGPYDDFEEGEIPEREMKRHRRNDQARNDVEDDMMEDLGPEQKKVGQAGPTDKAPLRGKLVGACESVSSGELPYDWYVEAIDGLIQDNSRMARRANLEIVLNAVQQDVERTAQEDGKAYKFSPSMFKEAYKEAVAFNRDANESVGQLEAPTDQVKKIVKKNGQAVGEVGIDPEGSPGVGQWYMKCYATGDDLSGFDSMEEALAELKFYLNSGLSEATKKPDFAAKFKKNLDKTNKKADDTKEKVKQHTPVKEGDEGLEVIKRLLGK
jgi:hypothetical protein